MRVRDAIWLRRVARLGHLSVGIVYVLVGILAMVAAVDPRVQPADSLGVFRHLLVDRLGRVLSLALVCGLIADAGWQAMRAIATTEGRARGLARLVQKVSWIVSGLIHFGL